MKLYIVNVLTQISATMGLEPQKDHGPSLFYTMLGLPTLYKTNKRSFIFFCVYDNLIIAFNFVFHHNKLDWLILSTQAFGIDSHSKTPYVLKAVNSGPSKSSKVGP